MRVPVYCISLPNPERRAKIAAELERVGFGKVKYIHAQEPVRGFQCSNMRRNPRGEFGCSLSHLKAIATAIADHAYVALFVEDDIVFSRSPDFNLPDDWNVVYLGGHPRSPATRVNDELVRIGTFSCAEAYLLHYKSMRDFVQFWCNRAGQSNAMFDMILGEFAAQGGGYAYYPTVTHQPVQYSYIGGKVDDKSGCINKGWATNLA